MHFDRESTVVITKINNLSESVLTNYCQNFGRVLRCYIKSAIQTRNKESYALIKFTESSSVTSILNNRNHTINGTHVIMRGYHQDTTNNLGAGTQIIPSLMSNQSNTGQNSIPYDQIMQENVALKYEITNLQKSLAEAQIYSKTAYDTFQALREKFEAEQALTNRLKTDYTEMIESYETRLKQLSSGLKFEKDKIKDEPIDCNTQQSNLANHVLEMQVMKDRLEQAQIDLGKCQTENAILKAKLLSCEQQSDSRCKDLNNQYIRMKKQYDHISSCIKEFHTKLYQKKRLKTELKDDLMNKSDEENNNSNDDIVEVVMQIDPINP